MFFILSKILTFFIMPFSWILLLIGYSIFTKKNKNKKISLITAFSLLLFFSNGIIPNYILKKWEGNIQKINNCKNYDLAIILGGGTRVIIEDTGRVFLSGAADRMIHTAQLYQMGKIKKVLFTGGSGNLFGNKLSEGHYISKLLIQCGIAKKDLLIEPNSKNTRENALFSAILIKNRNLQNSKILLVTSAFHIKRSKMCFEKVGLKFDTFGCDYRQNNEALNFNSFIPNIENFNTWYMIIHEITGIISYKLAGYI